jgi:hypothetical protein
MKETRTIEICPDRRGRGVCRGCGAALVYGEIVTSGKRMCVDVPAVALETRHEEATRRVIEAITFEANHGARRRQRERFKRR